MKFKVINIKNGFVISFIICSLAINGQRTLNIDECISYALENNSQIQSMNYDLYNAEINHRQSKLNYLPAVYAKYNHYLNNGRSLNFETYAWEHEDIQQGNAMLVGELTIFNGLQRLYDMKATQWKFQQEKLKQQKEQLYLKLEVARVFYEVVLLNSTIDILNNTIARTQKEIDKARMQMQVGALSKSDMHELLAQKKKEELQCNNSKLELHHKYLHLYQLMSWQDKPPFQVYYHDSAFVHAHEADTACLNEITNAILNQSVTVQLHHSGIKMLEYEVKQYKSKLLPTVSASASISTRYLNNAIDPSSNTRYYFDRQLQNNQNRQVALTVNMPLYQRGKQYSNIRIAENHLEKIKLNQQWAYQELKRELDLLSGDIVSLKENIGVSSQMTALYEKTYNDSQEKYQAGITNSTELFIAKNNFINAQLSHSRLQVQLAMNIYLLKIHSQIP